MQSFSGTGTLAEWLGIGLQNRVQRFESAGYLYFRMIGRLHLFSFPLNLIIGVFILYAGWKCRRLVQDKHIVIVLVLLLIGALLEGLLPAHIHFTKSWPFVIILVVFLIVWGAGLFRSFSFPGAGPFRSFSLPGAGPFRSFSLPGAGPFRSFSLLGAGLWLALWAGMLGTPDEYKASITLPTHQYVHTSLPFDIRLDTFTVRRYPTGEPMEYTAELSFKETQSPVATEAQSPVVTEVQSPVATEVQSPVATEATLRVNHPVRYKGYRMYLLDYEQTPMGDIVSCTVLVTRQPWSILVLLGILLMMGGAIKQFIK